MTKKNNVFVKVLLSVLMLALMFSLVACGKKTTKPPKKEEVKLTAMQQILAIVEGINPIIDTLNGVNKDTKYLSAEAAIGADITLKDGKKMGLKLDLKTNLGVTDPDLELGLNLKGTDDTALINYLTLGYKNQAVYLREPLNAINDGNDKTTKFDQIKVDIGSLAPSEENLMSIAMDWIAGDKEGEKPTYGPYINFNSIVDLIKGLETMASGMDLDKLMSFSKAGDVTSITIAPAQFHELGGVLGIFIKGDTKTMVDKICDIVFDNTLGMGNISTSNDLPTVTLGFTIPEGQGVNKIALNVNFATGTKLAGVDLNLVIDLPVFKAGATKAATVSNFSGYNTKTANLDLGAALAQKGVSISGKASGELDFSEAKDIAFGKVTVNNNGTTGDVIGKFGTGNEPAFDISGLLSAFGVIPAANTSYYVGGLNLIKTINDATASLVKDYANWKVMMTASNASMASNATEGPSNAATQSAVEALNTYAPESIHLSLYKLLGGKYIYNYKNDVIGEKDVMALVTEKFGKYLRFDVKETYLDTAKSALDTCLTEEKLQDFFIYDTKLFGIDTTKVSNSLLKDKRFISGVNEKFILSDKETQKASVNVYTEETDKKDVLDLANLVIKTAKGEDWTVEALVDNFQIYIALLIRDTWQDEGTDARDYADAISALDNNPALVRASQEYALSKHNLKLAEQAYKAAKAKYNKDDNTTYDPFMDAYTALVSAQTEMYAKKEAFEKLDDQKWNGVHGDGLTAVDGIKDIKLDAYGDAVACQKALARKVINQYLGVDVDLLTLVKGGIILDVGAPVGEGLSATIAVKNVAGAEIISLRAKVSFGDKVTLSTEELGKLTNKDNMTDVAPAYTTFVPKQAKWLDGTPMVYLGLAAEGVVVTEENAAQYPGYATDGSATVKNGDPVYEVFANLQYVENGKVIKGKCKVTEDNKKSFRNYEVGTIVKDGDLVYKGVYDQATLKQIVMDQLYAALAAFRLQGKAA